MLTTVLLNALERGGCSFARLHHGGHPLAPSFVGYAHHDGVEDFGVALERVLDFFGEDLLATTVDAHRTAADERDGSVFVHDRVITGNHVAGAIGSGHESRGSFLGVFVVSQRDVAGASKPTHHSHGCRTEVVVEYERIATALHGESLLHGGTLGHLCNAVGATLTRSDGVGDDEVREVIEELVLARLREQHRARRHREQRRQVVRRARLLDLVEERTRHRIAGDHEEVRLLGVDRAPGLGGIELRAQHHFVAEEALAHHAPLRCSVHERWNRIGHQRKTVATLLDESGRFFDAIARIEIDATAKGHHHVGVAPHHTLGHTGGAAGEEDVEVVVGSGREITSVALRREGRLVVVADHEHREVRRHAARPLGELGFDDQVREISVVEQIREFVLDVPEVDVDPDRADLEDRPQRLHPLHAIE